MFGGGGGRPGFGFFGVEVGVLRFWGLRFRASFF